MRVHLLVATVPRRRGMVEDLLRDVAGQTVVPGEVHLVLDGYGELPPPEKPPALPVTEYRLPTTGGPGGRWRIALELARSDDTLVVFDDDQRLDAPDVVETLCRAVADGGAVSYMGVDTAGCGGVLGAGTRLVSLAAGVSAYRASALAGLGEARAEVVEKCGFDPFGELGDDDAVVSAHLWRSGVPVRASGPLAVRESPGGQEGSQFVKRQEAQGREGRSMFWQRQAIAKLFGWPWRLR